MQLGNVYETSVPSDVLRMKISGTIENNGIPLSGVTVDAGALGTQIADTNGGYIFGMIGDNTDYTITPSKDGYTFSPSVASGIITGDALQLIEPSLRQRNRCLR